MADFLVVLAGNVSSSSTLQILNRERSVQKRTSSTGNQIDGVWAARASVDEKVEPLRQKALL